MPTIDIRTIKPAIIAMITGEYEKLAAKYKSKSATNLTLGFILALIQPLILISMVPNNIADGGSMTAPWFSSIILLCLVGAELRLLFSGFNRIGIDYVKHDRGSMTSMDMPLSAMIDILFPVIMVPILTSRLYEDYGLKIYIYIAIQTWIYAFRQIADNKMIYYANLASYITNQVLPEFDISGHTILQELADNNGVYEYTDKRLKITFTYRMPKN